MRDVTRRTVLKCVGMGAVAAVTGCSRSSDELAREGTTSASDPVLSPSEWTRFTDAETGRMIRQLTNRSLESKHSYYDLCPWSADGRYLVFSSVDPGLLRQGEEGPYGRAMASKEGMVRVMDMTDGRTRIVARHASYHSHVGTFALWHPNQMKIYYHRADGQVGSIDLETGRQETLSGGMRQMSPDGSAMVYYVNEVRDAGGLPGEDVPQVEGVYTTAVDGFGSKLVVTKKALYAMTPNRDRFEIGEMTIGNSKWSPDGRNILLANFIHPRPNEARSLYIISRDGAEVRWLCHFGHHHSWSPDGASILFNGWVAGSGMRMSLIDFDGSNLRTVIDEPVGSHPVMSADGSKIADFDHKGIYIVRVKERRVERLSAYRSSFGMDIAGTHPHPVWHRDGTKVLYNSAETGHCEIYLIEDVV